jgi:hypothetical protein
MVLERRSVGLDVHARSIMAGVLDSVAGEVWSRRLPPATEAVLGWVGSLPGPVGIAYEAGPTGFGLARALHAAGVTGCRSSCYARGWSSRVRPGPRRTPGGWPAWGWSWCSQACG